jgi:hypothetical protein
MDPPTAFKCSFALVHFSTTLVRSLIMYTQVVGDKKQKKKQKKPKGHEIPVPERGDFLRDLKKVAKPSTPRGRPKK